MAWDISCTNTASSTAMTRQALNTLIALLSGHGTHETRADSHTSTVATRMPARNASTDTASSVMCLPGGQPV